MRRICIWGASLNKVDDEAQIIAGVGLIKRHFPSTQLTFFSNYGQRLIDFLAKEGVEAEVVSSPHLGAVLRAIRDASLFLIIGGVLFEAPRQAFIGGLLISMAKACHCPVVFWQASIFPYTTLWGTVVFRSIYQQMDRISAREHIAADVMHQLGVTRPVRVFADARLMMDPCSPAEVRDLLTSEGVNPDQPLIGLTTRHVHAQMPGWVRRTHSYNDGIAKTANETLAMVVAHLTDLGQVVVIPMHPTYEQDLRAFAAVGRRVEDSARLKLLSRRFSPREIMGIIKHCDLVLACRLGSAVLAAATATPFVAIAYEPRMHEIMQRLGLSDRVFDWRQVNYSAVIAAVNASWGVSRPKRSNELVAGLKKEAIASVNDLGPLITRGEEDLKIRLS